MENNENNILLEINKKLEKVIIFLEEKLVSINASGANPTLVNNIKVDYYGNMTPIYELSTVKVLNHKQLLVRPYQKEFVNEIAKRINDNSTDLNAMVEDLYVRVDVPELNEEKRKKYAKKAKEIGEESKISMRNIRKDIMKKIKKSDEFSEDEEKSLESKIQDIVNKFNKKVDETITKKISKIMSV